MLNRRIAIFFVLVVLVFAAQPTVTAQETDEAPLLESIAHAGGIHLRPNNTMVAFEYAVAIGADMLEMDVHATADGTIVVIHDDTIDRTTNGSGAVRELSIDEFQSYDAGYNWQPPDAEDDTYPFRGMGIVHPTLETVLAAFPDMPMTIELKPEDPAMVPDFCALLQTYDMTDQVIVASFHDNVMAAFREECPGVPTSAASSEVTAFVFALLSGNMDIFTQHPSLVAFQVPLRQGETELVTPEFVEMAHALGIEVQVWTINDRETMELLIELGVDGVITDRPDLALEVSGREPNSVEDTE